MSPSREPKRAGDAAKTPWKTPSPQVERLEAHKGTGRAIDGVRFRKKLER